jgi:hypothetical protein
MRAANRAFGTTTRRRIAVTLAACLLMTTACASNPPALPLALALADDRKEFAWPRFTWKPGVSLTYDVESHARIVRGEREESGTERSVQCLTAVERTVTGLTRVELVADGTKIGDFFYDSQGVVTDWILTDAATRELGDVLVALDPQRVAQKLQPERLALNEPVRITAGLDRLPGLESDRILVWPGDFRLMYTFVGHRLVTGVHAAEVRLQTTLPKITVRLPKDKSPTVLVIQSEGEGTGFYDWSTGIEVASYTVADMTVEAGSEVMLVRLTIRRTLNPRHSKGIPP